MKNTYQKIKQTARKHVFPAVIAGTLAYSTTSCKEDLSYLPLDQKFQTELVTKNKRTIDSLIQLGNENAKNAKTKAIEMSKDNRVSIKEMEGVLSKYNKAEKEYNLANKKAKTLNFQDFEKQNLSKRDKKLYDKISTTLTGMDFGKAEIQKDYEKQRLNVKVENPETELETGIVLGGIGLGLLLLTAISKILWKSK